MDAKFWLVGLFFVTPLVAAAQPPAEDPSVGQPLPTLEQPHAVDPDASDAAPNDLTEPPEPALFPQPAWLLPPDVAPASSAIAAAFDLGAEMPDLPTESELIDGQAEDAVYVSDIKLTSAHAAADNPRLAALLASVEKLAEDARSIGDLNDLIEQCGANEASFPQTETDFRLASVVSWAFNRRGEMQAAAGDDRTAYDDFQRAIQIDPDNWAALHNRALTLAEYGRLEAALIDFNQALRVQPTFAVGYGNRGELLLSMGELEKAERDFTRAITGGAGNANWYAGRAAARRGLGKTSDAVRDLNLAIQFDPDRADTYAERGGLYAQVGYFEQAIADLDAALRADPHCVAAYQCLAWLLSTCPKSAFRDADKALESAKRALRFGDAGDPLLLDCVAAAHASAGLTDEAVRYQQQALLVAPAELRTAFEQRLVLYRSGKPYRQPAR